MSLPGDSGQGSAKCRHSCQFLPSLPPGSLTRQYLQTLRSQGSNWESKTCGQLIGLDDLVFISSANGFFSFFFFSFFNLLGNFSARLYKTDSSSLFPSSDLSRIFQHPPGSLPSNYVQ